MSSNDLSDALKAAAWVATIDANTGRTYYYNKKSNATTWEKPKEGVENVTDAKDAKKMPTESATRKLLWRNVLDANTGMPYWVNRATKAVQWEDPPAEELSIYLDDYLAMQEKRANSNADKNSVQTKEEPKPAATSDANHKSPASTVTTPQPVTRVDDNIANTNANDISVWRSVVDGETGKTYWYNRITRETRWTPPALALPAPKPAVVPPPPTLKQVHLQPQSDEASVIRAQALLSGQPGEPPLGSVQPLDLQVALLLAHLIPTQGDAKDVVNSFTQAQQDLLVRAAKLLEEAYSAEDGHDASTSHQLALPSTVTVSSSSSASTSTALTAASAPKKEKIDMASYLLSSHFVKEAKEKNQKQDDAVEESKEIDEDELEDPPRSVHAQPFYKNPDVNALFLQHYRERIMQRREQGLPLHPPSEAVEGVFPLSITGTSLSKRSHAMQYKGILYIKSRSGLRRWKKRYFVIHRWLLFYFETSATPVNSPSGCFDLRFANNMYMCHPKAGMENFFGNDARTTFEIRGRGFGIIKLAGETPESAKRWFDAIIDAMRIYGCEAVTNSHLRKAINILKERARRAKEAKKLEDARIAQEDAIKTLQKHASNTVLSLEAGAPPVLQIADGAAGATPQVHRPLEPLDSDRKDHRVPGASRYVSVGFPVGQGAHGTRLNFGRQQADGEQDSNAISQSLNRSQLAALSKALACLAEGKPIDEPLAQSLASPFNALKAQSSTQATKSAEEAPLVSLVNKLLPFVGENFHSNQDQDMAKNSGTQSTPDSPSASALVLKTNPSRSSDYTGAAAAVSALSNISYAALQRDIHTNKPSTTSSAPSASSSALVRPYEPTASTAALAALDATGPVRSASPPRRSLGILAAVETLLGGPVSAPLALTNGPIFSSSTASAYPAESSLSLVPATKPSSSYSSSSYAGRSDSPLRSSAASSRVSSPLPHYVPSYYSDFMQRKDEEELEEIAKLHPPLPRPAYLLGSYPMVSNSTAAAKSPNASASPATDSHSRPFPSDPVSSISSADTIISAQAKTQSSNPPAGATVSSPKSPVDATVQSPPNTYSSAYHSPSSPAPSPAKTQELHRSAASPMQRKDAVLQTEDPAAAFSVAFELLSEMAFVVQRNKLAKTGSQMFSSPTNNASALDSSLRGLNATINDLWQGKLLLNQELLFHFPKSHHIQDLRETAAASNRSTHISFAKLLRVNTLAAGSKNPAVAASVINSAPGALTGMLGQSTSENRVSGALLSELFKVAEMSGAQLGDKEWEPSELLSLQQAGNSMDAEPVPLPLETSLGVLFRFLQASPALTLVIAECAVLHSLHSFRQESNARVHLSTLAELEAAFTATAAQGQLRSFVRLLRSSCLNQATCSPLTYIHLMNTLVDVNKRITQQDYSHPLWTMDTGHPLSHTSIASLSNVKILTVQKMIGAVLSEVTSWFDISVTENELESSKNGNAIIFAGANSNAMRSTDNRSHPSIAFAFPNSVSSLASLVSHLANVVAHDADDIRSTTSAARGLKYELKGIWTLLSPPEEEGYLPTDSQINHLLTLSGMFSTRGINCVPTELVITLLLILRGMGLAQALSSLYTYILVPLFNNSANACAAEIQAFESSFQRLRNRHLRSPTETSEMELNQVSNSISIARRRLQILDTICEEAKQIGDAYKTLSRNSNYGSINDMSNPLALPSPPGVPYAIHSVACSLLHQWITFAVSLSSKCPFLRTSVLVAADETSANPVVKSVPSQTEAIATKRAVLISGMLLRPVEALGKAVLVPKWAEVLLPALQVLYREKQSIASSLMGNFATLLRCSVSNILSTPVNVETTQYKILQLPPFTLPPSLSQLVYGSKDKAPPEVSLMPSHQGALKRVSEKDIDAIRVLLTEFAELLLLARLPVKLLPPSYSRRQESEEILKEQLRQIQTLSLSQEREVFALAKRIEGFRAVIKNLIFEMNSLFILTGWIDATAKQADVALRALVESKRKELSGKRSAHLRAQQPTAASSPPVAAPAPPAYAQSQNDVSNVPVHTADLSSELNSPVINLNLVSQPQDKNTEPLQRNGSELADSPVRGKLDFYDAEAEPSANQTSAQHMPIGGQDKPKPKGRLATLLTGGGAFSPRKNYK